MWKRNLLVDCRLIRHYTYYLNFKDLCERNIYYGIKDKTFRKYSHSKISLIFFIVVFFISFDGRFWKQQAKQHCFIMGFTYVKNECPFICFVYLNIRYLSEYILWMWIFYFALCAVLCTLYARIYIARMHAFTSHFNIILLNHQTSCIRMRCFSKKLIHIHCVFYMLKNELKTIASVTGLFP